MKRRSLLLIAPRQLKWIEEEIPEPAPDEILAQTVTCAVSIGTELQYYRGMHRGSQAVQYPKMTGYESVYPDQ